MKHYIAFIILALSMVACSQHSKHWEILTQVESYIEESPDSALNVLQGMDKDELSGMEEKAKHALLLSMAMDKNYIDRTDFDILQPAIDYYKDNGSATDKLRTYYYQGRIYQNADNDALAMRCYITAHEYGGDSNDILTKARLYVAQGNIYASLLKWDDYIDVNMQAAECFLQMNRTDSYVNCLIKICNGHIQNDAYEETEIVLNECGGYRNDISNRIRGKYYSALITYQYASGKNENIAPTIEEYLNIISDEQIDYLSLANGYLTIGEFDKALEIIIDKDYSHNQDQELRYYSTLGAIYLSLKRYNEALSTYFKYYELHDSIVYSIFESDTQFIEERHALEMQKAKETEAKNRLTILVLACVIALMASLYTLNFIRKHLKETKRKNIQLESEKAYYEKMYLEVLSERNALNDMISNSTVKDETMKVIKKRLSVLNTIIVSHLSEKGTDVKRANEELEKLIADRNDFIKSTRLTLEENYPHFFAYLHDKGLEDFEIDFCCLYAIGLKGKEIKTYTNLSRHYKDSSEVRQKLGLVERDTNLSIFLQKLLKNEAE